MIGAILKAQILSMRPRVGSGRAGMVFSVLTGLLFYGVWTVIAFGVLAFFSDPNLAPKSVPALSTGLFFAMLYWQLAPVITAGFGASLDLRKLQVYPIPHSKLFTVEVLLRLTNCAEMLILLAGATAGLIRNPVNRPVVKATAGAGALVFAVTNILLSAGARHWIERLFARRRFKELSMLLIVAVALIPQMLVLFNVRKGMLVRLAPSQIGWPWGAVTHLMLDNQAAAGALLAVLYLAIAFWFGRRQFERSFLRDEGGSIREPVVEAKRGGFKELVYRMPSRFLPDPLGALVEKELRTLFRIPRFRMVYAMSAIFGLILYLPALRSPRLWPSFWMQNALTMMALYGLMLLGPVSYWNAFGFDRSAAQGYFSWPLRFRDALVAKNVTVALLLVPQILMIALAGKAVRLPVTFGKFFETIAVILIAALYWFAMGNIFSVRLPRAMDPERMNQMANKMQALSIWTAPLLLLPIVLAYWARAVFESEIVFVGVLLIAAIVGGIFYYVGLDSAVTAATQRREAMLTELAKADGPLSIA